MDGIRDADDIDLIGGLYAIGDMGIIEVIEDIGNPDDIDVLGGLDILEDLESIER